MPKNKQLKLIIDTNLWISFIISNRLNVLDTLFFSEAARLVFCPELITEINQTIKKPKLQKYFKANALEEMLSTFEPFTDLIKIKTLVAICRDPNDNFLLALAKDGNADYLLTGDKDLLEMKKFGKTYIMTISEFIAKMKNYP